MRLLQRGPVRCVHQFDDGPQIGRVAQQFVHPAIVELEKVLEHQAGEQLMLTELLGTEPVRVRRQRRAGRRVGHLQHLPWRFAGLHPAACNPLRENALALKGRISTEQLQAHFGAALELIN